MKSYKKIIIITTLITILPLFVGLILWNRLPDTVATHWDFNGEANGWSSKAFAVLGLPSFLTVVHLFTVGVTLNDPKKKNIHRKMLALVFWIIPVVSLIVNGMVFLTALQIEVNVSIAVSALVGIIFIIIGNYLPKLQQNYTAGIKLPWTLNSTENWNRTHRLGGKTFIISGILLILCGFLGEIMGNDLSLITMLIIIVLCAGVPAVYSFWLFRKGV